jgi:hypothetical protein
MKKEKNILMMSKKLPLASSILVIFFFNILSSKADLRIPKNTILPTEVIKIQLIGLMNNDKGFEDSGIEQTWNFAHPTNKKNTGPLPNFKRMIKGNSYKMLIDHLSHTITKIGSGDNWAQFEVIILDKDKIYHKFNWQVEKYVIEGPLQDCWLTTMVSSPIPLGSSI